MGWGGGGSLGVVLSASCCSPRLLQSVINFQLYVSAFVAEQLHQPGRRGGGGRTSRKHVFCLNHEGS